MNFGIVVLIVLGSWALLSIAVSVTIGGVTAFRDGDEAAWRFPERSERDDRGPDRERIAS